MSGVALNSRRIILRSPEIRDRAAAAVAGLDIADPPWEIEIRPYQEPRNLDQNARLWAKLHDIARQVQWPMNGQMQRLTAEDWKHIFTAGLEQGQRIAQGIEGGFVVLGTSTSRMSKRKMAELIELVQLFGDQRQVRWTELANEYEEARMA